MILDVAFVKNYLRVDHDEDDGFIELMIDASRSFVETYLNRKLDNFDGYTDRNYPKEIDIARLNVMSQWYDTRTIMSPRSNVSELEYVFKGLLDPHRYWQISFVGGHEVANSYYGLDNIYYDSKTNRFYHAEIVDTYTALTGDSDLSNVPSTSFYADPNTVDYNKGNRL